MRPPAVVKLVKVPAVALLEKAIVPTSTLVESATRFCRMPELFVIPTPLISSRADCELVVIVNTLAPALNTIPANSVLADTKTSVILETSNVAVLFGPLGTVGGVQLAAVFQSLLVGLRFHVALPAKTAPVTKTINMAMVRTQAGAPRRGPKGIIFLISLRESELDKCCMILIATTSSCASEP